MIFFLQSWKICQTSGKKEKEEEEKENKEIVTEIFKKIW